jgi:hypothetical protein
MLADFEPIILEEGGFNNNSDPDDKIYLQPEGGQSSTMKTAGAILLGVKHPVVGNHVETDTNDEDN